MASAPLPGAIARIYAVRGDTGAKKLLHTCVNEVFNAGGSPDGVLANLTVDKWARLPLNTTRLSGTRGDVVAMTMELTAADGSDASDCILRLPIISSTGGIKHLTMADIGFTTDVPAATAASVEIPLGAGYSVPYGEVVQVGGGPAVISLENDA